MSARTSDSSSDGWPARLGKSGCAWVIPVLLALAMVFREADQLLIAVAALSLSFALPLMCVCILFAIHSARKKQRLVLIVLAIIHFALFGWLLWNKSMIWQYWL